MQNCKKIIELISKLEDESYIKWLMSSIEKYKNVSDDQSHIIKNNISDEEEIENLKYLGSLFTIVYNYYSIIEKDYKNYDKSVFFIYEDKIIEIQTIIGQGALTVVSYANQDNINISYNKICKLEDIVSIIKKQKYEQIDTVIRNIFKNIKYLGVNKDKILNILEEIYYEEK